ncbi:MAG: Rrf2 family transcriptional regulator [Candidatus Omnitrophica bacterium]|nr:Rrf2 family transcriptional regulator [Candidatus Omnitrophota bacterium]
MKLSTRTRYGVRALIDIGSHFDGQPILIKDIAKRQEISKIYLEQIMLDLKNAGIVRSVQGTKGGFVLEKEPSLLTIKEVVESLQGRISIVGCITSKTFCHRWPNCPARELWVNVNNAIINTLDSITLEQMIIKERKIEEVFTIYGI